MDTREEQIAESVRELFAKNEENFAQYQDNGRYRFYWRKLQKTAVRALGTLKTQVEMGTFRPEYFEWGFGSGAGKSLPAVEVPLSEGQTLRIRGIVDRVDILREEGETYIRILDYKSGNAKFDEKDMQDGIGLQLPGVSEGGVRGDACHGAGSGSCGDVLFSSDSQCGKSKGYGKYTGEN